MLKPTTVQWLRSELKNTSLCRAELARELCRRDEWRNPQGELCAASARKGLPQLARDLGLPLPAPSRRTGGCARRSPQGVRQAFPAMQVQCSLEELGEVRLCLADTPEQRRHWSALLAAEHPLGRGLAPGCRLVYGIRAQGLDLGVLSWVAAPLRLAPRDQLLGWDERARRHNIARLVSNDRFLIREGVQVRNLASHVLAQALRRLPRDWEARYGAVPVAVETCVGQPHKGTCYKAAGFEPVGETAGYAWGMKRPRQRKQQQEARPAPQSGPGREEVRADPKQVWMQGLTQEEGEWKAALRAQPQRILGRFPPLELDEDAPWSRREFERSDLPDRRLRERLLTMGEAWEHKPGRCLPDLFPSGALQQGAYRFLHNGRVSMEDVLQPHREALAERCRQVPGSVLLVQDTTTLNYTGLKDCTAGLGPLKERSSSSRGLHVRAAVAFTEGRRPLGVSGLEVWSRPLEKPPGEDEKESRRWFRGLEQGYELAGACPDRRIVVVGDGESDIFDLFRQHGERSEEGVELLVRVHLGRQRLVRVWDPGCRSLMIRPLRDQPDCMTQVRFERSFEVDSQGGRRARKRRTVETEVCIGAVEVQAAGRRGHRGLAGARAADECGAGGEAAGVVAHQRRGRADRELGAAHRGLVRGALGHRGVLPGAQGRDAHRGPQAADGGRAAEVPGVRRRHRLAGVFAGAPCARRAGHSGGGGADAGRARGDRDAGAQAAVAAAAGAGPRPAPRHPHLGGVAGPHGRIPAVQAPASAGQPDPVAGLHPCGGDRALPATGPQLRAGCRGSGTACSQELTHPRSWLAPLRLSSSDSEAMRASRLP